MEKQTSTEQPDPTQKTPLQYLARIGTLEGLLEQARERRDKAEAEVAELRNKCEAMRKVCDAAAAYQLVNNAINYLRPVELWDIEAVNVLIAARDRLFGRQREAVAEYRKHQESTERPPAGPGLALAEPDRRGGG